MLGLLVLFDILKVRFPFIIIFQLIFSSVKFGLYVMSFKIKRIFVNMPSTDTSVY